MLRGLQLAHQEVRFGLSFTSEKITEMHYLLWPIFERMDGPTIYTSSRSDYKIKQFTINIPSQTTSASANLSLDH